MRDDDTLVAQERREARDARDDLAAMGDEPEQPTAEDAADLKRKVDRAIEAARGRY